MFSRPNGSQPEKQLVFHKTRSPLANYLHAWNPLDDPETQLDHQGRDEWYSPGTCIHGPSDSGKTYFMRSVLWTLRTRFEKVIVFTGGDRSRWHGITPPKYIRGPPTQADIDEIVELANHLRPYGTAINSRIAVCLDDFTYDRSALTKRFVEWFCTQSRNYGVRVFVAQHSSKGVWPAARNSIKIHVVVAQDNVEELKHLQQLVAPSVTVNQLRQLISTYCKNHTALVFDSRRRKNCMTTPWPEWIFTYRAPPFPQSPLGSREFWASQGLARPNIEYPATYILKPEEFGLAVAAPAVELFSAADVPSAETPLECDMVMKLVADGTDTVHPKEHLSHAVDAMWNDAVRAVRAVRLACQASVTKSRDDFFKTHDL